MRQQTLMIDKVRIEAEASAIYAKYFKRGSPASKLQKIIAVEGIKFREIDDNEQFLGALVKSSKGIWYIYINKNIEHIGRKNFTTAHELGHFVLQHTLHKTSFWCTESDINENGEAAHEQEREADYFASCFLLPRDRVIREFTSWYKWKINQDSKVFLYINVHDKSYFYWKAISSNLKKIFQVSETALKIRLVNLGLINNF